MKLKLAVELEEAVVLVIQAAILNHQLTAVIVMVPQLKWQWINCKQVKN